MEAYFLLVTLHVILFAYWLGGDFGVYVCSRYIARPDLSLSERERFLEALLAIDILPRSAIVLLPAVGLQLAVIRGSASFDSDFMTLVWLIALMWLGVVWMAYRTRRKPQGRYWQRIDVSWRVLLILALLLGAVFTVLRDWPLNANWLAAKLVVYSALLMVGLYLRVAIQDWKKGFIQLHQGHQGPAVDELFIGARRRAKYAAYIFWALIGMMAWLGIRQPF